MTALVFALPATGAPALTQWLVFAGLLALQAVVLLLCRVELRAIVRPVWKLKWLFALLIVFYALLPPETACCDTRIGWPILEHNNGVQRSASQPGCR